jgi:hypothetical protein
MGPIWATEGGYVVLLWLGAIKRACAAYSKGRNFTKRSLALSVALQGRELELCHTPDIIAHRRNRKFDRYVRP